MTKIFCIGRDFLTREHEDVLESKNTSISKFDSVRALIGRHDDGPDLIIIDIHQSSEPSLKEFLSAYRDVPIVVFSQSPSFRGFSTWTRYAQTYPASAPCPRELRFIVHRILSERNLLVQNSELKKKVAELKKEVDFFDGVGKTLTSTLELNDILAAIMKRAKRLVQAETWSILLIDRETGELVSERSAAKYGKKSTGKCRLRIGESIAGRVAREGVPVVVPDIARDNNLRLGVARELNTARSVICVPIKNKGKVIGVLEVANRNGNPPFTREDLTLLMRLVDHASLAIERASLYRKMAELSVTDDLTKLFNTRYMNRTLEIEIARAARHDSSLSLIFMDIDHFKVINDSYGHLVGSKLLVEMGQLLIKCLRTIDIVARYGGDEFVIVLPQTAPNAAIQIAERIRKAVERNVFLKKEGYSLTMTASFGVASYPESAGSKEELLRLADEAMYRVKYQTRNGVYAIV